MVAVFSEETHGEGLDQYGSENRSGTIHVLLVHTSCSEALNSVQDVMPDRVWPSCSIEGVGNQRQVDVTGQQLKVLQWGSGQLPADDLCVSVT